MKVVLYGAPVVPFESMLPPRLKTPWDIVTVDDATPEAQARAAFANADAVVAVDFDRRAPAAPQMRMVHVPGAGCDGIDVTALPTGASLCNVHKHEAGVAEYVMLAMLQWNIRLFEADASFRSGSWERSSRFGARPVDELGGRTLGIIGLGNIGRMVAKRAKGFDMRVVAAEYFPIAKPDAVDDMVGFAAIGDVAAQADFLVVCCALTEGTRGLVGGPVLSRMKNTAVLINVGRGPLVDEDALWQVVSGRRIAGAVIDVWYRYPDARDPNTKPSRYDFATLPNIIMTPHIAGWTAGTVQRRWDVIAENLDRLAHGEPLLNVVTTRQ